MLKHLIDRPVAVTMILLSIMVLGIVSAVRLPVSLIPDVDIPCVTLQVSAPGMSARELDESVVSVLRAQMAQIDGISDIRCESTDGNATITMKFAYGDNLDFRFIEVNERVDRCMGSLPAIDRPKALKSVATDIPAFFLEMTAKGNGDFLEMSRFAKEVIVKRLEQMDEIAMVDVSGCEEAQILVIPDRARLQQAGLSMQEMQRLISSADLRLGNLTIRDGQYRYNVRFQSNAGGKEDIENIWLNHDGKLLRLGDIADVSECPAPRTGMLSSNGKPAISMAIIKQSDARVSKLRKALAAQLRLFETDYPQVEFRVTRDQTELLDYSIRNLIQNIIVGIILACLIIFLFMKDFRSPGLVALTMPLSLIGSMLVFRVAGMSLNIISLSGLLLGVGMLTDNVIVLLDNITARWQRGDELRKAVTEGTSEVMAPMLSSILTTCAVFIPLVSVSGIAGAMFRDQAIAISTVLLVSYLITIIVIPVYYWALYRHQSSFRASRFLSRMSLGEALERWDGSWSRWMLGHRGLAWTILGSSAAGLVLCFVLMPKEMLPPLTEHDTIVDVDWGGTISPEENLRRSNAVAAASGSGTSTVMAGSQQFVLSHSGSIGAGQAIIYLDFPDAVALKDGKQAIMQELSRTCPEAKFSFRPSGNIFDKVFSSDEPAVLARLRPVESPVIELSSLKECVDGLRESLPDVVIPEIPVKEQIIFTADPQALALYDISYENVLTALRGALNSDRILNIVQGDRTVPVILGENMADADRILEVEITRSDGSSVPLSSILTRNRTKDLKTLVSGPEGPYYPVALNVPSAEARKVMESVRASVSADGRFESGFSGSWFSTMDMIKELILTVLIAVILLFLILAAQFESILQPVIILLEIVIDIFFSLAVLWILGQSINLMSLIGLVVITGIVINDSILKVDTINRLRRAGMGIDEAIHTAGRRRVKAIVMTSLTTILAMCPFLVKGNMGADLQFPMSVVIIAGMAVGTLVSLFLVPVFYKAVSKER